ncbi:MAG: hypothetical protein AB7O54_11260 [Pseudomonadales bacterium]
MADRKTQSERDFELFCKARGWKADKLPTRVGQQTPDYRVTTDSGRVFIAEVTESDQEFVPPPPPDIVLEPSTNREPNIVVQSDGDRRGRLVGNKISSKKDQVQALGTNDPTVIVVFAKDLTAIIHMDEDEMDHRLNGSHQVVVDRKSNQGVLRNGDDGLFAKNEYQGVSAVATLYQTQDQHGIPLRLKFFHNSRATTPLSPHHVRGSFVEHYVKDPDGVGWIDPFGAQNDDG